MTDPQQDRIDRAVEAFDDVYDGVSHNKREAIAAALAAAGGTQRLCWPVWSEGYRFSPEESGPARFLGWWPGDTFAEACAAWAAQSPDVTDSYRFDAERLTWWGCRLFDNEAKAREHFG